MSDKDLLQRDVIREIFPGTGIYICIWHTLRTFSRQITAEKMNLTAQERSHSLEFLSQLLYSNSSEHYDEIYKLFSESVPFAVLEYFNKNWHPIRYEWTVNSMTEGNAGNVTNNKLENVNGKIKQVVKKNSNPAFFIHSFMTWFNCHKHDKDHNASDAIMKRSVKDYWEGTDCINFLPSHWHQYILEQVEFSKNVTILEKDDTRTSANNFNILIHGPRFDRLVLRLEYTLLWGRESQ